MTNNLQILILCTGSDVPGPAGTWARYLTQSDGELTMAGFSVAEPTYGKREDVERWLSEEYQIPAEHISTFHQQVEMGAKPQIFCFDIPSRKKVEEFSTS